MRGAILHRPNDSLMENGGSGAVLDSAARDRGGGVSISPSGAEAGAAEHFEVRPVRF